MKNLQAADVWISKKVYEEAEEKYYETLSKEALTPLAGEVAKARQKLIESREIFTNDIATVSSAPSIDLEAFKFLEKKIVDFDKTINGLVDIVSSLSKRIEALELHPQVLKGGIHEINVQKQQHISKPAPADNDEDVDLFGSDSDEESAEAAKVREERLAAYAAKKSKKPVLIAKSNVILDIKPWDDETDMKAMEANVRKIEADGLLWGAAKLVPLAYGIHKLQISCVVEDDKISIDWLQEQLEELQDFVQSVDIAAFNKI